MKNKYIITEDQGYVINSPGGYTTSILKEDLEVFYKKFNPEKTAVKLFELSNKGKYTPTGWFEKGWCEDPISLSWLIHDMEALNSILEDFLGCED